MSKATTHSRGRVLIGLVCALLAFTCPVAATEKSVGQVARVAGSVELIRPGEQAVTVATRQQVLSNDTLKTGGDGWVTVNFFDLTRVVMRPNTEFHIKEFPQTMDGGGIALEIHSGGARVSTGTIATRSPENFTLQTPNGVLRGSRAEWVVRVCGGEECQKLEASLSRCEDYQSQLDTDSEFVAVYKGVVDLDYCPIEQGLGVGQTAILNTEDQSCKVVEEVPCFILFDGKLGRDKARQFMPMLEPVSDAPGTQRPPPRPDRPNSRTPRPGPRNDRPRRPRR